MAFYEILDSLGDDFSKLVAKVKAVVVVEELEIFKLNVNDIKIFFIINFIL